MINDMTEHMFSLRNVQKNHEGYMLLLMVLNMRFYSDELCESKSIQSLFEHSEDRRAFAGPWCLIFQQVVTG
jgi:hypothetical protein